MQHAVARDRNEVQVQMWMESRLQAEGDCPMTAAQLREQALRSSAFLVAAIEDRRFGSGRLSSELKDAIEILRDELGQLGLMAEYKDADGSLVAWPPSEDGNIAAVLRRPGALDNKPSRSPYANDAW